VVHLGKLVSHRPDFSQALEAQAFFAEAALRKGALEPVEESQPETVAAVFPLAEPQQ